MISEEVSEQAVDHSERIIEIIPVPEDTVVNITYPAALKELIKYAAPYTASSIITIGGSFIGVVMVSKLGAKELAASNLTSSIQGWMINTVGATLGATAVVAARKIGSGEALKVGSTLHKSWVLTLLLSAPSIAFVLCSKPILGVLRQSPESLDLVEGLFKGYSWGIPAVYMLFSNRILALATGNAHINLPFDIFYQVLNCGLSYCFIFGALNFPKLGFSGLGYSNSITAWTTFLGYTLYMFSSSRFRPYGLTRFVGNSFFSDLGQLVKIGSPMGLKVGVEFGAILAASLMIGRMGTVQQAAQESAFQYAFLSSIPMYCIMDASSALVSRYVGEKNIKNAKKIGYSGLAVGISISLMALVIFVAIPKILARLFLDSSNQDSADILNTTATLMWINGIALFFDSIRNISSGALAGFYDTLIPPIIIVLTQIFINIPISYVLGFYDHLDAPGVMAGRAISIGVGAPMLLARWMLTKKPATVIRLNQADEVPIIADTSTSLASAAAGAGVHQHTSAPLMQEQKTGMWLSMRKWLPYYNSRSTSLAPEVQPLMSGPSSSINSI